MAAGNPPLTAPRGPRLLRRCPICGLAIQFWAVEREDTQTVFYRHPTQCPLGPQLTLLAETQNGRGDWTAFALRLGLTVGVLDEYAVAMGVMPPAEKSRGRLLDERERRAILKAYRNVNGENDEPNTDAGGV